MYVEILNKYEFDIVYVYQEMKLNKVYFLLKNDI